MRVGRAVPEGYGAIVEIDRLPESGLRFSPEREQDATPKELRDATA